MIIQNNNPNLYNCTGMTEGGRLALIPVIAFEIIGENGKFNSYAIDLTGALCGVVIDKATDMIYRHGKPPEHIEDLTTETTDLQRGSDLFASGI